MRISDTKVDIRQYNGSIMLIHIRSLPKFTLLCVRYIKEI